MLIKICYSVSSYNVFTDMSQVILRVFKSVALAKSSKPVQAVTIFQESTKVTRIRSYII